MTPTKSASVKKKASPKKARAKAASPAQAKAKAAPKKKAVAAKPKEKAVAAKKPVAAKPAKKAVTRTKKAIAAKPAEALEKKKAPATKSAAPKKKAAVAAAPKKKAAAPKKKATAPKKKAAAPKKRAAAPKKKTASRKKPVARAETRAPSERPVEDVVQRPAERPLTDEEREAMQKCAQTALAALAADGVPEVIVTLIGRFIDEVRAGALPEPANQDVRLGLGVLWGEQVRAQVGWRWVHLSYPNGFASYALVPDDRAFACFPLNRLGELLREGADGVNTSVPLFDSIRVGTLPERSENAYLVIG
jgi:hypothetical protein